MNAKIWNTHAGHVPRLNLTKLIGTIDNFADSYNELTKNRNNFTSHSFNKIYIQSGPLRECKTIHLVHDQKNNQLEIDYQDTFKFLKRLKQLIDIDGSRVLTKAYVTILESNKTIYPHSDTDGQYWEELPRYQFYYTGNRDVIQIINDSVFPVGPGYLYLFDHRQIHEYHNNSKEDLMLLVFDLKK